VLLTAPKVVPSRVRIRDAESSDSAGPHKGMRKAGERDIGLQTREVVFNSARGFCAPAKASQPAYEYFVSSSGSALCWNQAKSISKTLEKFISQNIYLESSQKHLGQKKKATPPIVIPFSFPKPFKLHINRHGVSIAWPFGHHKVC
jgi:hypothetical protein